MLHRLQRDAKRSVLVALLLCLTCTLMSVGIIAWQFSDFVTQQADDTLTTIAVRTGVAPDFIIDDAAVQAFLAESPSVVRHQFGAAAVASAGDVTPVYSVDRVDASYKGSEQQGWDNAALVVTITEIAQPSSREPWQAAAKVERVLACAVPEHMVDHLLLCSSYLFLTEDGDLPVEVGKQYVVYGRYYAPAYVIHPGDEHYARFYGLEGADAILNKGRLYLDGFYEMGFYSRGGVPGKIYTLEEIIALEERVGFTLHETWPYLSPAQDEAYISRLTEMINWNNRRLLVYALDEPEQMLYFHEKEAFLLEGRWFTPAEKAEGTPVCLISAALAEKNGLSVGDLIPCELAPCSFDNMNSLYGHFTLKPALPGESLGQAEYMVVGIYATPAWDFGPYAIDPNTILVPRKALTAPLSHIPYNLQTVILRNGSVQAFQAELAAAGFPNEAYIEEPPTDYPDEAYHFYDQGYGALQGVFAGMQQDARGFLLGCLAIGYVLAMVILLLYGRTWFMENRILHMLGMPSKAIFFRMAGCVLMLIGFGFAGSLPITYAACGGVVRTMRQLYLHSDLPAIPTEMDFSAVLPLVGINALALLLAGVGAAYLLTRRKKLKW